MPLKKPTTTVTTRSTASRTVTPPDTAQSSRRVLACVHCSRRKAKCDHNDPCGTCVKAGVPCIPSQPQQRRKRRFAERDLLARIRHYEQLLRRNHLPFEPLHPDSDTLTTQTPSACTDRNEGDDDDGEGECEDVGDEDQETSAAGNTHIANSQHTLSTMRQEASPARDASDAAQGKPWQHVWDDTIQNDQYLAFAWPSSAVAVCTLHPQPVQAFQLWQLYIENVDPLLKVTHTPSLQGRIIEAMANVSNIPGPLEALMFSIYSIAVLSIGDDECYAKFACPKAALLASYQHGCQQALAVSGFLRCTSRDCLTAFYMYLVSARPRTSPESLSSMLSVAIRTGQRMGIDNETTLAKATPFEAEMSRRLWWSLVQFDSRISEMADVQPTLLVPTWDCRIPLNANDTDLWQDMRMVDIEELSNTQRKSSDALFAVVRGELGNFARLHRSHHCGPMLQHANWNIKSVPRENDNDEVSQLEAMIRAQYLTSGAAESLLQFMTTWTTRGAIAKLRLLDHHFRYAGTPLHHTETQRETAASYALTMLQSNTMLAASPRAKGFLWMVDAYFPFVGYVQTVQYLMWRPVSQQATMAWKSMNDNYCANEEFLISRPRLFDLLANFLLQAWAARETAFAENGSTPQVPDFIVSIKARRSHAIPSTVAHNTSIWQELDTLVELGLSNYLLPMSTFTRQSGGIYPPYNNGATS